MNPFQQHLVNFSPVPIPHFRPFCILDNCPFCQSPLQVDIHVGLNSEYRYCKYCSHTIKQTQPHQRIYSRIRYELSNKNQLFFSISMTPNNITIRTDSYRTELFDTTIDVYATSSKSLPMFTSNRIFTSDDKPIWFDPQNPARVQKKINLLLSFRWSRNSSRSVAPYAILN